MRRHRWTLLLIPPKNERAREFAIPGWSFRALAWGSAIALALVIGAVTVLFTPWGTPGSRLLAAQNEALQLEIAQIEARFRVFEDTLIVIGQRDERMRMLAGLPIEEGTASLRRRPFQGRLGWSARPDVEGLIARATDLSRSFRNVSDTLQQNFERFANTPSLMPTAGWLSSQFTNSRFHPILHENRPHEGIDVTAPTGTPIVAPAAGIVVAAGNDRGYGLTVEIDHGNGIRTRFAHCSRLAVKTGQRVTRGQVIAAVGATGLVTAPHLHYEIHVNGKPVDPLTYVLPEANTP